MELKRVCLQLHLEPVFWGYALGWWDKAALINARVETAGTSHMFKSLWRHGWTICFANEWVEWKKEGDKKQPYIIHRANCLLIFMAVIGSNHSSAVTKLTAFSLRRLWLTKD